MEQTVKLTIMSHLSDAEECLGTTDLLEGEGWKHIEFAKFLILKYSDTKVEHDPDSDWGEFQKRNMRGKEWHF